MGMFDTVMHNGLEWQTKSIDPGLGGTMSDYEVRDSRLWLLPCHLEATSEEPPEPETNEPLAKLRAFNARHRRVDDPPEDTGFHGVLDIYRDLPRGSQEPYRFENRRLIFVLGHLVSETPLANDAERESSPWSGSHMPKDPKQKVIWVLHAVRGMLGTLNASADTPSVAVPSLKQAEASVSQALLQLES